MPIDSPTSLGTKVNAIEPVWTREGDRFEGHLMIRQWPR